MSILLKQPYFLAFERQKLMHRVVLQKCPIYLIWRGGIGPTFGLHKTFSGNQSGLSYELAKSDLG